MYKHQYSPYLRGPNEPGVRWYPAHDRSLHWGLYEILSSALFIGLSMMMIAGIAALVVHLIGFDSLTQIYGFDAVVDRFDIESSLAI
jgi:hypothetical protein